MWTCIRCVCVHVCGGQGSGELLQEEASQNPGSGVVTSTSQLCFTGWLPIQAHTRSQGSALTPGSQFTKLPNISTKWELSSHVSSDLESLQGTLRDSASALPGRVFWNLPSPLPLCALNLQNFFHVHFSFLCALTSSLVSSGALSCFCRSFQSWLGTTSGSPFSLTLASPTSACGPTSLAPLAHRAFPSQHPPPSVFYLLILERVHRALCT